jgi:hypothetical protein
MNFTTGRTFPSRSTWTRLQYAALPAGLALALGAALAIGWPANISTGGTTSPAVAPPAAFQPAAEQVETTIYIVGSQAEAEALESAAINEGGTGPTRVVVAASPEDDARVSFMASEQAHGVLQGTNIIDLRDR